MKIVQFKDGLYAIRKVSLSGYQYKDLSHPYWWTRASQFMDDCKTADKHLILKVFNSMADKGKVAHLDGQE
jgi:hypothetical protein